MDPEDANRREAAFYTIAADTGFSKNTIAWIAAAVCIGSNPKTGEKIPLRADSLCAMLVSDIDALKPGNLEGALRDAGIQSSRDIGRIVYALVDAGIVNANEGDDVSQFDDVFDTNALDPFLARAGIRRRGRTLAPFKRRIAWTLYGIGMAFIVMSWGHVVSYRIGWAGWVVAMIGVVVSWLPNPKTARFPVRTVDPDGSVEA